MSIELPATFIHRYSDMTEKLLKAVLTLHTNTHAHTLLPFSFIQKTGNKFARISFDTVPHKSHAINIDFSIAFWYLCAFRYFGCFPVFRYFPVFICTVKSPLKICLISQISINSLWHVWVSHFGSLLKYW